MDESTSKIILAIIALIASIIGGVTIYSKRKSKNISYDVRQRNINITGNENKIVGGDDKSTN